MNLERIFASSTFHKALSYSWIGWEKTVFWPWFRISNSQSCVRSTVTNFNSAFTKLDESLFTRLVVWMTIVSLSNCGGNIDFKLRCSLILPWIRILNDLIISLSQYVFPIILVLRLIQQKPLLLLLSAWERPRVVWVLPPRVVGSTRLL